MTVLANVKFRSSFFFVRRLRLLVTTFSFSTQQYRIDKFNSSETFSRWFVFKLFSYSERETQLPWATIHFPLFFRSLHLIKMKSTKVGIGAHPMNPTNSRSIEKWTIEMQMVKNNQQSGFLYAFVVVVIADKKKWKLSTT